MSILLCASRSIELYSRLWMMTKMKMDASRMPSDAARAEATREPAYEATVSP